MQVPTRIYPLARREVSAAVTPGALAGLAATAGLTGAVVHLHDLDGAANWACGEGAIYPASMIKTPLAVACAVAVEAGRITYEDTVPVNQANMTVNDAPSTLVPGYAATVGELVALMLERSDNVATNLLFDCLDRERATADIVGLGFPGTAFRRKLSGADPLIDDPGATGRNTHPAAEAAGLFVRIARGTVPGADRIRAALARQFWNTKLSAGLADGDRFAHKTGDTDATSHDGGILELAGGGRFVLVVYTPLASNDETDARFAAFMRDVRPHLAGRETGANEPRARTQGPTTRSSSELL